MGVVRECAILRRVDVIYLDEIRKSGLYAAIWQAFAVLLPVRTIGVMGDQRTYEYVCALREVNGCSDLTNAVFGDGGVHARSVAASARCPTTSVSRSKPSSPFTNPSCRIATP